ncbi:IS630 family transposase [Paenibacillus sp. NPDC055715]
MNDEIDHLLFEDESMIRDYQAIQKTWFLRGKQRIIQTTGKHRGVKLLATVDYATGQIVWQEDEQYTAETFLACLQKVLEVYPEGNIVIVLDNARIYHAKLLQPFLDEQKNRLGFVFLPPYSPQLRPVLIASFFSSTYIEHVRLFESFKENASSETKEARWTDMKSKLALTLLMYY